MTAAGDRPEPEWWAQARRLRAQGLSYRAIAREVGKSQGGVWRALNTEGRRGQPPEKPRPRGSGPAARRDPDALQMILVTILGIVIGAVVGVATGNEVLGFLVWVGASWALVFVVLAWNALHPW